jgi:hypothetical protein
MVVHQVVPKAYFVADDLAACLEFETAALLAVYTVDAWAEMMDFLQVGNMVAGSTIKLPVKSSGCNKYV